MFDSHIEALFCSISKPRNLKEFGMPLSVLVPRADYFLTQTARVENIEFDKKLLGKYFKDGLLKYFSVLHDQGYLNRNGVTSSPVGYTLIFDQLRLKYVWIPKNACTFVKKRLLDLVDKELLNSHIKNRFHESVQSKYGLSMPEYTNLNSDYYSFAVLRDPIERFVSCYTDKFVSPVLKNKNFEKFAHDVILRVIETTDQNRDPSTSISFKEFLDFVVSQPTYVLNEHWRPQYAFLGNETISLCTTKNLASALSCVLDESKEIASRRENQSFSLAFSGKEQCSGRFRDFLPKELELENLKNYGDFLSHEDYERLAEFYKNDFPLYEQASLISEKI